MELIIQKIYCRATLHVTNKFTITTSLRHPSFFYIGLFGSCWDVYLVRMFRWLFDVWCAPKLMGIRTLSVGFMIIGFRLGFMYRWGDNPEMVEKFKRAKDEYEGIQTSKTGQEK